MLVSDYILKFLYSKGVKKVFLITGGACAFLVDAFSRNKKIKYISVAHEQAAAMMADSYSRLGPNFGATMVTSGPGATNLLTGIACSWFDSIPNIHICGQVNTFETAEHHPSTKNVRQVGFQETDIVSMAKPITKFAYRIKTLKEIPEVFEKAYRIATSGRPGPVLIDLPMNFQKQEIIIKPKKNRIKKPEEMTKIKKYNQLFDLLNKSNRPCIILGGGIRVSKSTDKLKVLLKQLNLPILNTWSGLDAIHDSHKNFYGTIGVYGNRSANFVVQNADLVLNIGSRLDTRITGGKPETFARSAKIISVDIDKNELFKKRGLKNFDTFNCDISEFLIKFIKVLRKKKVNLSNKLLWINKCNHWKEKFPKIEKKNKKFKNYVNPYFFMDKLSDILKKDDVIISDDGAHLTWSVQAFKLKEGQRFFSAFGNSPMGYAFPASIGASLAYKKKKRIICIDGDGSIQINLQELHTLKKLNLPIKVFIFNNNGYGIIKQFQSLYLGNRYEASGNSKGVSNPNFRKISKAFGLSYNKITSEKNLKEKLKKIINSKNPEFIDVIVKNDQKILPKLEFGRPIEDLSPLLKDNEFKKEMIVKTMRKDKKIKLSFVNEIN
ncbi:thiamine pyrophosphate-binding protein [Candidatus Pelagibacter sp.]|nr:thiamine pyrophosphate-binding protein [Candidatus Pelagibacter sp.]